MEQVGVNYKSQTRQAFREWSIMKRERNDARNSQTQSLL